MLPAVPQARQDRVQGRPLLGGGRPIHFHSPAGELRAGDDVVSVLDVSRH